MGLHNYGTGFKFTKEKNPQQVWFCTWESEENVKWEHNCAVNNDNKMESCPLTGGFSVGLGRRWVWLCKVRAKVLYKVEEKECGVPRGDPERRGWGVTNAGTASNVDQVTSKKRNDLCAASGFSCAVCWAITPCDTVLSPLPKVFSKIYHWEAKLYDYKKHQNTDSRARMPGLKVWLHHSLIAWSQNTLYNLSTSASSSDKRG